MKLAMHIGGHYKLREVKQRHFAKLAKSCRYSEESLLATLRDLAQRLPDEGSSIVAKLREVGIASNMLHGLLGGLTAQCTAVLDQMQLK